MPRALPITVSFTLDKLMDFRPDAAVMDAVVIREIGWTDVRLSWFHYRWNATLEFSVD